MKCQWRGVLFACLLAWFEGWELGLRDRERKKWCERHLSMGGESRQRERKEITDDVNIGGGSTLMNQNQIEVERYRLLKNVYLPISKQK